MATFFAGLGAIFLYGSLGGVSAGGDFRQAQLGASEPAFGGALAGADLVQAAARPATSNSATSVPGPMAKVVTCSLRVDYPHNSGHNIGRINVVAKVECTHAVPQIQITVVLARDGSEVSRSTLAGSNRYSFEWHTDTPCVDGLYQGAAQAIVTFPPGIALDNTLEGYSSPREITC